MEEHLRNPVSNKAQVLRKKTPYMLVIRRSDILEDSFNPFLITGTSAVSIPLMLV